MTKPTDTVQNQIQTEDADFARLVALLGVFSDSSHQLAALEAETNGLFQSLIEDKKDEYATLQSSITQIERAAEELVKAHPEWFAGKARSIKTPFGSASFKRSASLEVADKETTIACLEKFAAKCAKGGLIFNVADYLREDIALNLEALEKLDDDLLERLGVLRKRTDAFSLTPAKVSMAKAIHEAAKQEAPQSRESEVPV